jgi:hypothetical protein
MKTILENLVHVVRDLLSTQVHAIDPDVLAGHSDKLAHAIAVLHEVENGAVTTPDLRIEELEAKVRRLEEQLPALLPKPAGEEKW